HGGISFVLADGQRSGKSAKIISNIAARKVISLLGEGARDGVAARAAHDYLYAMRGGKVRADLQLLSLDLDSNSIVITRNTDCGALLLADDGARWLEGTATPIGLYRNTRPLIHEFELAPQCGAIIFSDGIRHAGSRSQSTFDVAAVVAPLLERQRVTASLLANTLLERAIEADKGFPKDDLTVVALYLHPESQDDVRRLSVSFPIS
ncbi:MAG: SpoIIE family protein phosphatase, partial [Chloroflexota bacterium]|nr:SpoIIE family protein phosphatase [Chloroflexota bacterium]